MLARFTMPITNITILVSKLVLKDCLDTLKTHKQDTSYCAWQEHYSYMNVLTIQPTSNIHFREILDGKKPSPI